MQKRIKQKLPKLQMRAEFQPTTLNEETRTMDLTWTTGHKGLRRTMFGEYYEELSLEPQHVDLSHFRSGRGKFLASHNMSDLDAVIGIIESANIGDAKIRWASDDISQRNLQKVRDGILTDVSVGYIVDEYTDVSKDGDEIPTYRATKWKPIEISLVPTGFDPGAVVRSEEQNQTENEVEIITRSENIQESIEMPENNKPAVPQLDAETLKLEAAQAERKRSTEIRQYVKTNELDETLAEDMIERGLSVEEAKRNADAFKRALEASKKTQIDNTTNISVGQSGEERKREAIESSLIYRLDKQGFDPKKHARDFIGYSMVRIAEELLGGRRGMTDAELVKRAMSTSDLPKILANVAEKSASRKYATAKRTFEPFVNRGDLRNYKPHKQVKLGDFASLNERQESGEFEYSKIGEEQEQAQLVDYGRKLKLTKQMIINDDLQILARIIEQAGVAAARKESQLVYSALTGSSIMEDGVELFHASHGNLAATGTAINDASFAAASLALRNQKTVDKEDHLELSPSVLIVGAAKENEAKKFLSAILASQTSNVNIYANSVQLVVENRISGNQWFVAADKNEIDTITLFGMEGQTEPVIASRENWDDSSIDFKVEHTLDAAPMDYRGLYKNPGA